VAVILEELIPELEHESDSCGYTTNGDGFLGNGIDGESDVGGDTEYSGTQSVR
jgi:hypothetical protein